LYLSDGVCSARAAACELAPCRDLNSIVSTASVWRRRRDGFFDWSPGSGDWLPASKINGEGKTVVAGCQPIGPPPQLGIARLGPGDRLQGFPDKRLWITAALVQNSSEPRIVACTSVAGMPPRKVQPTPTAPASRPRVTIPAANQIGLAAASSRTKS
jgi:hypothetical protein